MLDTIDNFAKYYILSSLDIDIQLGYLDHHMYKLFYVHFDNFHSIGTD